ncbi:MAG: IPExxxVDY family protein [Bacteroidota bacterium]
MRKRVLNIDIDYDFALIGICCQAEDYRLCWEINKILEIELERRDDITIYPANKSRTRKAEEEKNAYSSYFYKDEEIKTSFTLISNKPIHNSRQMTGEKLQAETNCSSLWEKSTRRMLIPEQKKTDYFLMIKGSIKEKAKSNIVKKIKNILFVFMVYEIDPDKLKSKQELLFF